MEFFENENIICSINDNDIGEIYEELKNPEIRVSSRGIVINSNGKIAIFNKTKKNEYKLPGGGCEGNESVEETFKREVLEETGCIVDNIKKIGITLEFKKKTNFKQISHIFIANVKEENAGLNLTEKEKAEGSILLWENPKDALELITKSYDKLLGSEYDSLYMTKYVAIRDKKILEFYIDNIM